MTRTEIAILAITALPTDGRLHLDVNAVMRGMKITTDEAVEMRKMAGERYCATSYGTSEQDHWSVAKTAINSYARNPLMR